MTPEAAWITFALCLLTIGATILITGLRKHDGKEPDSATTWQPDPGWEILNAFTREYHNLSRVEWERKTPREQAQYRDAYLKRVMP